jgi:hypothetical protein
MSPDQPLVADSDLGRDEVLRKSRRTTAALRRHQSESLAIYTEYQEYFIVIPD